MEALKAALKATPVFYINRDIERCIGFDIDTPGYCIISNETAFGKTVRDRHPRNVFLIKENRLLDTWELLEHPETVRKTRDYESRLSGGQVRIQPAIVVFKNTKQIEKICKKNNWKHLNPSADLANTIEEKITQVEWLGDLTRFLPPHRIDTCKNISWKSTPFILQFNRAHTGTGTQLIESKETLLQLQGKFPDRPVRSTHYVPGPAFTNNNVVTNTDTLVGPINYQITGLTPFTDNPFATVGNDWKLPREILSAEQMKIYREMAEAIGEKMRSGGWRGLFGIDVALEESSGKLYLIEINARQPASASFESMLQGGRQEAEGEMRVTTFEAHLAALLEVDLKGYSLIDVEDGAQVVVRHNDQRSMINDQCDKVAQQLSQKGFATILYANKTPVSELLRIQSGTGIMKDHNTWNNKGTQIIKIIHAVDR